MKHSGRLIITFILWLVVAVTVNAQQITGAIIDAQTGDSIPFASASYKGNHIAVSSNAFGVYNIERHNGWKLTFSAVGYKSVVITVSEKTPRIYNVKLKQDATSLGEVVVKAKKSKYSRKDNPAVELMKRVIAAKKQNKLENKDFYQYNNYEKLTLSLNNITKADLDSGFIGKKPWLKNQVEFSPLNDKYILPVIVTEKVTQNIYRKEPKNEKTIILGEKSTGINDLMETGDIIDVLSKDVFTQVDIYDDQVRLLQYPFTSPIGKDAIAFYRYYIVDTLKVDNDSCYHLMFLPNNQQDFGFRGELYILKDSTLHVKKVNLSVPRRSDVNFVENLQINQDYTHLDSGEWVLTTNDMTLEMALNRKFGHFLVARTSRRSDYAFEEINYKLFKGKTKERKEADAEMRGEEFWSQYRKTDLTKSESGMGSFIKNIQNIKGFNWMIFGLKALIENFVETGINGAPSKLDIGPVNTMISKNDIDGLRFRLSGQTTANLNKNWFFSGYAAYGCKTKKFYYDANVIYSFNKKEYLPREFPKRTLTISSTRDICSPSDKFVHTDKDNVFTAFKWSKVEKMMFYNRQQIEFEREEEWGFKTKAYFKAEKDEATGEMLFKALSEYNGTYDGGDAESYNDFSQISYHRGTIRTSEFHFEVEWAPGRTYINTKQRRLPINLDAPVINISHTIGIRGFLGGQYSYNVTEAQLYKRVWLKSWGKMDTYVKGGIQWSQVPYPLLIAPAANLSYLIEDETFNLINNMEFLNDRYISVDWGWDLNGKIFNRIPLIKKLKWREWIGVKMLWGTLSDKNNPTLEENWNSRTLMAFPRGCYIMDKNEPYAELILGVHNIFKLFQVEYVRRLSYLNLPTASKHGIRFTFRATF